MELRLERKGSGRKEMFEELVNLSYMYRLLCKNPERKIRNINRRLPTAIALFSVILIFQTAWEIRYGFSLFGVVIITVCAIGILLGGRALLNIKESVRIQLEDNRPVVLILNEDGIRYQKEGALDIGVSWDQVLFVRSFKENICFVAENSLMLAADISHSDEILDFIRRNGINVRIVQ